MGQVQRRQFLIAASALLASPLARAQAPAKLPTVGVLSPGAKPSAKFEARDPLRKRREELGWFEGKTFLFEPAYADGDSDRLPALADMLVAKRVDVIWALGPEAAIAAARATKTIPIVFWGVSYPVESGLVDSLAKPGRNVTGVAWTVGREIYAKRIQFLRDIAPNALRLGWLDVPTISRTVAGNRVTMTNDVVATASRDLGFELREFPVVKPADFEPTFASIEIWGAQALLVSGAPLTETAKDRIIDFARRRRLPAMYSLRSFVEEGGLVSYSSALWPSWIRTVDYLDKVLRGANPAGLPVDLPTTFTLAINLKTAKELGVSIPHMILLQADRVIE